MNSISFRVLGPREVNAADGRCHWAAPNPRLLPAAMVLQPNVVVSTELLIDVLWPSEALRSAAA